MLLAATALAMTVSYLVPPLLAVFVAGPARLIGLARAEIENYPDLYKKYYSLTEYTHGQTLGSGAAITQANRNPILGKIPGADGLKTGFTKEGGYGMVGSAVQNGLRLIVVVNGLEDPDDRASEAKKMLEWGFRNFEARTLFAAQQPVGYAKVFGGESRSVYRRRAGVTDLRSAHQRLLGIGVGFAQRRDVSIHAEHGVGDDPARTSFSNGKSRPSKVRGRTT